jgi:tetratricopeptide (TPR) repeat protein
MAAQPAKKKCFVVMGFGAKPDYATGRTLDLDKTYRIIIRKAVEQAGLECIRADDVIHSGTIDKPMYQLLLEADVVVADLSTSNPNAIYELGVRHALRPHTTIVMAEKQFKFPFDLGHLMIRPYEHLGTGIDAEEADRVREELKEAIVALAGKPDTDSPVYTFLPTLKPPAAGAPLARAKSGGSRGAAAAFSAFATLEETAPHDETATELMDMFKEARGEGDWRTAARVLKKLLEKRPRDCYFKQQLALATYKAGEPDPETALAEACRLLGTLEPPETTTDTETLGLWGAVHKRLWALKGERNFLEEAIRAYEKGFHLKHDHYNGINLAYLLNVRASIQPEKREAVADVVLAERYRRQVADICEKRLEAGVKDDEGNPDPAATFWLRASLAEALLGSGQPDRARAVRAEAAAEAPEPWMLNTLDEQLATLEKLLAAAPAV